MRVLPKELATERNGSFPWSGFTGAASLLRESVSECRGFQVIDAENIGIHARHSRANTSTTRKRVSQFNYPLSSVRRKLYSAFSFNAATNIRGAMAGYSLIKPEADTTVLTARSL